MSFQLRTQYREFDAQMVKTSRRCGLTVIELLVTLVIVAIISTISLVSLNSARESTRNMTCVSNQRQIGVAIAGYEAAFRVLPTNWLEEIGQRKEGLGPVPVEYHSAHTRLLPFLDEASTFSSIPFGNAITKLRLDAPSVFRCPSESRSSPRSFNYCYSAGTRTNPSSFYRTPVDYERPGAFGTTLKQISTGIDSGLSSLIFVSERSVGSRSGLSITTTGGHMVPFEQGNGRRDWYTPFFSGERPPNNGNYSPNQWTQICSTMLERKPMWMTMTGGEWAEGKDAYFNEIMTPNSQIPDCGLLVSPMHGCRSARSEHRAHVNVLFGDGSVRGIEDGIELQVWRDLGTVDRPSTISVSP